MMGCLGIVLLAGLLCFQQRDLAALRQVNIIMWLFDVLYMCVGDDRHCPTQ